VVLGSLFPGPAAAGTLAFPNSVGIFAPADQPSEILISTSLGLVTSEDAGRTWTWSCGKDILGSPGYVQASGGPHRLFAYGSTLFYSDDGSCSWHKAAGLVGGAAYVYGVSGVALFWMGSEFLPINSMIWMLLVDWMTASALYPNRPLALGAAPSVSLGVSLGTAKALA
jgi:hypothetical protein